MQFSPLICPLVPLSPKYSPLHPILKLSQPRFVPQRQTPSFTPIHKADTITVPHKQSRHVPLTQFDITQLTKYVRPFHLPLPVLQISTQLRPKVHTGRQYTGELWAAVASDVPHHPPVHILLHHVDLPVMGHAASHALPDPISR
jgi:hypothetical protein